MNTTDPATPSLTGLLAPASASASASARAERADRLAATLSAIEDMGLDELRELWIEHFGLPPALRSVDLMRLSLSWRLQARIHGGLDPATRRKLKTKPADQAMSVDLEIGAVLVRDWQGQRIEVTAEDAGFRWQEQLYPSLSAVALAVTGTRWNGPRFFGLRGAKP